MNNENRQTVPNVYVYIDGFNFYYGVLKGERGLKWLNLDNWLQRMLPKYNIVKIKYFTAMVSGLYDKLQPVRQSLYLRALRTVGNIEIIKGTFLNRDKKIQINKDVKIIGKVPEEKGTDVNIGVHLVNDAHNRLFDAAVIVSNDSDLSEAVRIVAQEINLPVGIINPFVKFNKKITQFCSFKKRCRKGPIKSSQFSDSLQDSKGAFHKPASW